MHNNTNDDQNLDDRYRSMLKAYYERLKEERQKSSSHIATEEVKLRLFLSLLDRPAAQSGSEALSA